MISKRARGIEPSLTLEITAKAAKLRAEGRDIVGLGAGEPDMATPGFIIEAAERAMRGGKMKYTATAGILELRKAICEKLRRENGLFYEPEQIVVSNGAKQSLFNVVMCAIDPGDEVIVVCPYWITYTEIIKLAGGKAVFVGELVGKKAEIVGEKGGFVGEKTGFLGSIEAILGSISNKTRAVILNSPSNPGGVVYSREELEELARGLCKINKERGGEPIVVISDEIYEKLTYGGGHFSIARVYPNTVVVNGFSKSHAMTGWRVGWTACSRELADAMVALQSHTTSSINAGAQYGALVALTDPRGEVFIREMQKTFRKRRDFVLGRLEKMRGITFTRPDGAFYVLVDVSRFGAAAKVAMDLLERGVAVIPCEQFGAPRCVRISYAAAMDELKKGMDRMEKYFIGCCR